MNSEQIAQILAPLDNHQREVATCFGRPLAVIAGAGTGKTRAITHRIAYGVLTGYYQPQHVLAVTFTNKAAGELQYRLAKLGLPKIQARTFHSAALRQASYFWPKVTGHPFPNIAENPVSLVAMALRKARIEPETSVIRDVVNEINWLKVSNLSIRDYAKYQRDSQGFKTSDFPKIFENYEKLKFQQGLVDFNDVLLLTVGMLSEYPDIQREIQSQYRHFIVDEYQDISPIQHRLLTLWLGEKHDICGVGDPAQTIHSYAGASAKYLLDFAKYHFGAVTLKLGHNYRCSKGIMALGNNLAKQVGGITLNAISEGGKDPVFLSYHSFEQEAEAVADWLAEAQYPRAEMAVLARTRAQLALVEAELAKRKIPYLVQKGDRFFEKNEVKTALKSFYQRSNADLPVLENFISALQAIGWQIEAPESQGAARERWESWQALLAIVKDILAKNPQFQSKDLAKELQQRESVLDKNNFQAVNLATIHAAKGLEWQAVALISAHDNSIPYLLAKTAAELAEEKRLLYVGITRAKTELRISWVGKISRFLANYHRDAWPLARPRSTQLTKVCRECGFRLKTANERKIGCHIACGRDLNHELYQELKIWRKTMAETAKIPAFVVFTDSTLWAIAKNMPQSEAELLAIPGIGRQKLQSYAAQVLSLCSKHKQR